MNFATDENFKRSILNGLIRRLPDLDIIRIQDTEMYESPDPELLNWLAEQERILLTHDVQTMPGFVYERIRDEKPVIGVIVVQQDMPIGQAVNELELLIGGSTSDEFENQVKFVPLQ